MKKLLNTLIISFMFTFMFIFNVDAECSYQERKELLRESKLIEAFFDVDLFINKFTFNLYNLSEKLYVKIENDYDKNVISIFDVGSDSYKFDTFDVENIIKYKIKIYSKNDNCFSELINTKTVIKPIVNKYSKEDICNGIEEFYYCKNVLTKKITLNDLEVYKKINEYKKSLEVNDAETKYNFVDFLKQNYIYFVIGFLVILIVISVVIINKRRGEL
ncbi:MAG: hypothetical protein IJD92_00230 [Bacilli bacterium]|nr:hypothetical protein [Bacilli bacterium]